MGPPSATNGGLTMWMKTASWRSLWWRRESVSPEVTRRELRLFVLDGETLPQRCRRACCFRVSNRNGGVDCFQHIIARWCERGWSASKFSASFQKMSIRDFRQVGQRLVVFQKKVRNEKAKVFRFDRFDFGVVRVRTLCLRPMSNASVSCLKYGDCGVCGRCQYLFRARTPETR